MCIKNTETRFGIVAIAFHWVMAVIIIGLLVLGLWMVRQPDSDGKFQWYTVHKSFGLIILSLVVLRLIWREMNVQPRLIMPWFEKALIQSGKIALYFFMFAMPLSGWLMSSAGGYEIHFFNWFVVPPLMAKNETWAPILGSLHEWMGYGLIAVIVFHMLGAYKHHFYDKDDILKRMISPK